MSSGSSSRSSELLRLCLPPVRAQCGHLPSSFVHRSCLDSMHAKQGILRVSCSPTGLCAVTTDGYVILVDVAAAKLAAPDCLSTNEPALFDPAVRLIESFIKKVYLPQRMLTFSFSSSLTQVLPECASCTSFDDSHLVDLAFSPSVRIPMARHVSACSLMLTSMSCI